MLYKDLVLYLKPIAISKDETKHFDYVCQGVTNGIKDLNIALDIPVIFGVLNRQYKRTSNQ